VFVFVCKEELREKGKNLFKRVNRLVDVVAEDFMLYNLARTAEPANLRTLGKNKIAK
jgi:hypothetical protein